MVKSWKHKMLRTPSSADAVGAQRGHRLSVSRSVLMRDHVIAGRVETGALAQLVLQLVGPNGDLAGGGRGLHRPARMHQRDAGVVAAVDDLLGDRNRMVQGRDFGDLLAELSGDRRESIPKVVVGHTPNVARFPPPANPRCAGIPHRAKVLPTTRLSGARFVVEIISPHHDERSMSGR